jgi:Ca2+-binding EF-hand superfamily protein
MVGFKEKPDLRTPEEREASIRYFAIMMRQAAMECDAFDSDMNAQLDFDEFSTLIRDREVGVHSEVALQERFDAIDADSSGYIDLEEYMIFALRDAFVRAAANVKDLFNEWDEDGNGVVDMEEFRSVVRHFGFSASDEVIDRVFRKLEPPLAQGIGFLVVHDLSVRLQQEVRERSRPLNQLRCHAWKDAAVIKGKGELTLDPKAPINEQIRSALEQQSARVLDLFRAWDVDENGIIDKFEFRRVVDTLGFEHVPVKACDAVFAEFDVRRRRRHHCAHQHHPCARRCHRRLRSHILLPGVRDPP